jgi:hypothetical protein
MDMPDRWVAKVHPLDRAAEADDPMELMADMVVGDPEVMLECILHEFIWMGWGREELLALVHDPGYPVLCELYDFYGPEEVERRVENLLARTGHLRFTAFVAEPDEEDDDHGPELLQILPMPEPTA